MLRSPLRNVNGIHPFEGQQGCLLSFPPHCLAFGPATSISAFHIQEPAMPCRGVFFALSATQAEHLLALARDDRLAHVQDGIEATWDEAHLLQTDKAWDAIHRWLTDGTRTIARSEEPLGKLIAGGSQLYADTQN